MIPKVEVIKMLNSTGLYIDGQLQHYAHSGFFDACKILDLLNIKYTYIEIEKPWCKLFMPQDLKDLIK